MPPEETPLAGGFVSHVVRVGDTVRRPLGPWSQAVHALLRHLEAVGFTGAPRLLGIDKSGREILEFIDGVVPVGAVPEVVTDDAIADVGRLMRQQHRAMEGFELPEAVSWHFESLGGPAPHVVCHHDLSPKNTVFRDGRAVAFIDWDLATPEAPIHDVVHAAWQFVPLASDDACLRLRWSPLPDRGHRLRLLLDAYGLETEARSSFAARVAERMEITASGVEGLAREGHPAFQRMVAAGITTDILRDQAWVIANADSLDAAIRN